MAAVEEGSTVVFHYTGKLSDGQVFDSSHERGPMEAEIGAGQILPAFESSLIGMEEGDNRTFTIAPEDAYGEYDESLCRRVEKERFAEPETIEVGMVFQVPLPEDRAVPGTIIEVSDADVLMDLNHPLAGKELTFEVECLEVKGD